MVVVPGMVFFLRQLPDAAYFQLELHYLFHSLVK